MEREVSNKRPLTLIFTSFRDSIGMGGLKLSLDRKPPKHCSYPVVLYMVEFDVRSSQEKLYDIILEDNWLLIKDLLENIYGVTNRVIFCCWCVKERLNHGGVCIAPLVGKYIKDRAEEFEFPIEVEYRDGRKE